MTHKDVSTRWALGIPGKRKGIFGVRSLNWSLRFKLGLCKDEVRKYFMPEEPHAWKP